MKKINNGTTRWIIVAFMVGGMIFNTAIVYNDVKHIQAMRKEDREVNEKEHKEFRALLMEHILEK
jgi:hypothetical protein